MRDSENKGALIIGCVGLIPAAIIGCILRGWAIVTLWVWFATPVFHIDPPNYAISLGLGILGGLLAGTADIDTPAADKEKRSGRRCSALRSRSASVGS